MKSQLKKAVFIVNQQIKHKRINEQSFEMGLFCRKIVKQEQIIDNFDKLCSLEEAQKTNNQDEEKSNKILIWIIQYLILECQIENSIQYISGVTLIKEINNSDLA
ncbi:unnamed protein product [Paramecium sonneborni]|uniref:Uncharacterized protein n=1 Tax=Paramecium sonneborni TaxID=65129 RepID=A0A8S1PZT2_9CILI|nr:unnamed protein product [Paramecium sonneborni]